MCGIAGIVTLAPDDSLSRRIDCMVKVQSHRGPDGEGQWMGRVGGSQVALGSRRLAILDLSEAGRQPMVSPCGRHVLVYNGEVYNYKEIRQELESLGIQFRSQCDTEVVLRSLMVWKEEAFKKFNGMWGLAWLDLGAGTLTLSRDRFGIKPVYYYQNNRTVFFASEIKSILAGSGERFRIYRPAVSHYLRQSLQDAQAETFFSGIRALPAGRCLTLNLNASPGAPLPAPQTYWTLAPRYSLNGNAEEGIRACREVFFDAVKLRLRSDVPVGVLLSGGVDSSSIAAAMRAILGKGRDLHILSAVSDDRRFDERPFVNRMAAHLGTEIKTAALRVEPEQAYALLEKVTWFNDEPAGSFSNVAHFLLMEQARERGITVALSGQGADEILCGYKKYPGFYVQSLLREGKWAKGLGTAAGFLWRRTILPQFRVHEAKRYLPRRLVLREVDTRGPMLKQENSELDVGLSARDVVARQAADLERFSVPALVHSEDRMSMAWSREIRLPFLDYRLVNLLLPLDAEWKLRRGWTKWVFRKALEPFLPQGIAWRKDKQGFTLPGGEWMRNQLRPQIGRLFKKPLLTAEWGLVNQETVQRLYDEYCRQPVERGWVSPKDIFSVMGLEVWARRFEPHLKVE